MKKLSFYMALVLMLQAAYAQNDVVPDPPLRSDSLENVIAELEQFIPEQMAKDKVTGLSCALIRDGKIVWTRGFGITNSLSRAPVTTQTVFSVASQGKAISAYLAMKMVEQGKISLDAPLVTQLKTPWLPRSSDHDAITLRNLLTHTSGLSNFLRDQQKNLRFKPGGQYSYSGVGFMYMQAALTQISGKPLDELARENVFEPLEMANSYFDQPRQPAASLAAGHITFERAIAPFGIIFTPSFLILLLIGLIGARWQQKRWRVSRGTMLVLFLLASGGTFYFLVVKAGGAILAGYFTFCALLLLCVWLVLAFLGAKVFQRLLGSDEKRKVAARAAEIAWGVASLVLLFLLLRDFPTPLPNWFEAGGNAASSLRATSSLLRVGI